MTQKSKFIFFIAALCFLHSSAALKADEALNPEIYANTAELQNLINRAKSLRLHDERYWHLLLHYNKTRFGNYLSEADNNDFFLAPDGKKNPENELRETLKSFFIIKSPDGNDNLHMQCRFPARFEWLKEKLAIDKSVLPEKNCSILNDVIKLLQPDSISIVFASYFMNAPASMYGHTLMKFNKEKMDLLNYSINYAAYPGDLDFFRYTLYGLIGGYPGKFAVLPYHMKVREYNDMENRDMWEYKLNLKEDETKRIILHSIELVNNAAFEYFYLDENCSYHLLSLVEVGRPSLHLRDKFKFWVIPVETMKTLLMQQDLVSEINYRPSLYSNIKDQLRNYNSAEKKIFFDMYEKMSLDNAEFHRLNENDRMKILDTFLSAVRYKMEKDPKNDIYKRTFKEAVKLRAELPQGKEDRSAARPKYSPTDSHGLFNVEAGLGFSRFSNFSYFHFSPQAHYLLSSDDGYAETSSSIFFDMTVRNYHDTNETRVHKFSFIKLVSLMERSFISNNGSYIFDIGAESVMIKSRRSSENEKWTAAYLLNSNPANDLYLYYFNDIFFGKNIAPQDKLTNFYVTRTLINAGGTAGGTYLLNQYFQDNTATKETDFRWIYAGNMDIHYGYTLKNNYSIFSPFSLSLLGGIKIQPSKYFNNSMRAGPAITTILTYNTEKWQALIQAGYYLYTASGNENDYKIETGIRYNINRNFQLGISGELSRHEGNGYISISHSF